ncbi:MAG: RNA methyltransferase [Bacteroidota bacterium]|nr:RNA methyltransferase [Bacteroidota bacterium]
MKFLKNEELGRPGLQDFRNQKKMPVTIVLDNVRSGLNVGSIFRTADSFNAGKIFLCGITAQPPERDILKSALGATESVSWNYFDTTEQALREMKAAGYKIFAIEQGDPSTSLEVFKVVADEKYALVFGNEVKGVSETLIPLLDGCIEIPQSGIKHSLNISVCAGVVLWKFYEQLMLGKA